jgi:transcriptional regulator GlxA family with amidase domain
VASPASPSIAPTLEWMQAHLTEPLALETIANRAHLSVRTLSRRFRSQTGLTPLAWLTTARLRLARSLLETTDHSVEQVAAATGLGSAVNFRARFAAELGTTPTAYRRAFRTTQDSPIP